MYGWSVEYYGKETCKPDTTYSTHIAEITEDNGNSAAFTCVLPLYINQPERAKNEEYEKKGKSISVLGSMFFSYTELLLLIVRTCAGWRCDSERVASRHTYSLTLPFNSTHESHNLAHKNFHTCTFLSVRERRRGRG